MKRLELAIGDLAKVLDAVDMEADWLLEEPEHASTPLHRLVCESEISGSNPPVLFRAWQVSLCLRSAGYMKRWSRSAVQLRLDVQDDPCDRVGLCGLWSELDLGERDDAESDDQERSRRGDAGKVFHRDLV
ncbi:hypothetical protein [Paraburkholderia sp. MM5384-R2]|uniref:hypothetical protein n=1 Tax=Paraburkholderia sp. MM5384-R2 TaxID=2723097 RepID=UPI0016226A7D|nr:hypothetical protein [Paraburkholderia sp. MM5384-R2]MBB5499767.1 hypothetical protein [Paraburkholderia sp. MM5384-R2]